MASKTAKIIWGVGGAVFGLALAAGGGVLYAQTTTVISACVNNFSGRVSFSEDGACAQGESLVSWNTEGPQGQPGISGYETVLVLSNINSDDRKSMFAPCPEGKKVIGGGAAITLTFGDSDFAAPIVFKASYPATNGIIGDSRAGYRAVAYEFAPYDGNWTLAVNAICANVAN
jgi:hypothetical protein